jgi:sarcosine oxidase subunit gamma
MAERSSPLAGVADRLARVTGAAIAMAEVPFLTQLDLRLDPDGPAAAAVGKELGLALPTQPCTSARLGDYDVLWLGPDEWLVVGPPGAADRLTGQLRSAVGAEHASVVDVSAQRTALDLSGANLRDLLAMGCAIDLHPRAFGIGDCVQTVLAHVPVVLLRRDPGFRVLVRASFAAHLVDWLVDASVEYTGLASTKLS